MDLMALLMLVKVDKRTVLFLEEIDKLYIAILAKIALQLVVGKCVEIFGVANIHVARCARVHIQGERGWKWTSIFAPTEFEQSVVQR